MIGIRESRIRLPQLSPDAARHERRFVLAAFLAILLLQLEQVFNRPVNWDEFYHLSQVHAQAQGRLSEVLQVLHVRLLGWLALLPLGEIDQVRIARLAMFGCELFTLLAIHGLARRLVQERAARLAPLLYLGAGFVFQHGMAFRADPLVTALLMGALWWLAAGALRGRDCAGIAVLLALAGLATVKAVLFAPAFAAIAWWRLTQQADPKAFALRLAATVLLSGALLAVLVLITQQFVPPAPAVSAAATVQASQSMLLAEGLLPRWQFLLMAAATAPMLVLAGAAMVPGLWRTAVPGTLRIVCIGLILPLASVLFYRNAFPYFYAFILAPVVVGLVPGIAWLARSGGVRAMAAGSLLGCVLLSAITPRAVLGEQGAVLREVHRIFPQPVAYFDFAGMVAAFPKANVFMSSWGQTRYRSGEFASYADTVQQRDVPLLLANHDVLARNQSPGGPAWELLPHDAVLLRTSYVQHWGPIWLAGRRFASGAPEQDFTLPAGGTYTLSGTAALIDGQRIEPGSTVALARGRHRFAPLGPGETVLRWGKDLPRPSGPAPAGVPFRGF
ncbi:MAG TPA: hypothetical protein VFV30_01445 [Novosphingobium sp.]|nr:hypothetical protein [Novosphingobium sp.]